MKMPAIDKQGHFLAGLAICALGAHYIPVPHALYLTGIIGALKEASDQLSNMWSAHKGLPPTHGVEWMDFWATFAGGGAAALLLALTT